MNTNFDQWLVDSSKLLGTNLHSVYLIGSYQTQFFNENSDIDLAYILEHELSEEESEKIKKLQRFWIDVLPLEINFLSRARVGLDLNDFASFQLTCCLAWQGRLMSGVEVPFPVPDEKSTMTFHGIRLINNFVKLHENHHERFENSLFNAIQVLEKNISWQEATSKSNISSRATPSDWNIVLAKKICLNSLGKWDLPNAIKDQIRALI